MFLIRRCRCIYYVTATDNTRFITNTVHSQSKFFSLPSQKLARLFSVERSELENKCKIIYYKKNPSSIVRRQACVQVSLTFFYFSVLRGRQKELYFYLQFAMWKTKCKKSTISSSKPRYNLIALNAGNLTTKYLFWVVYI